MIAETVHPRSLPQPLAAVCAGLAALGAFVFVAGLFVDEDTTWRAFHVNYLYFAGLINDEGWISHSRLNSSRIPSEPGNHPAMIWLTF